MPLKYNNYRRIKYGTKQQITALDTFPLVISSIIDHGKGFVESIDTVTWYQSAIRAAKNAAANQDKANFYFTSGLTFLCFECPTAYSEAQHGLFCTT